MSFLLQLLQIELTRRCNERCVHCYIPHGIKNLDMDTRLLFDLLEQGRALGVKKVIFSGGEPMLHKDFMAVMNQAEWHGFSISIFSNLTLLTDRMIGELKIKHIKEVQTSLYSVESDVHDEITKMPGSCKLTKDAVIKLIENGIPVFISCPVMKQNKRSYTDVLNWAKQLGINSSPNIMITACSDRSTGNLENRLTINEAIDVILGILEYDTAYDRERFTPDYHNLDDALPCVRNICADSLCVNAAGDVLPSPGWDYVLGSLSKQSLQDIWEHSCKLKEIRTVTLDNFGQCKSCPDIQFCGMSLEGNANENPMGNYLQIPGHVCELARKMRELVHAHHRYRRIV